MPPAGPLVSSLIGQRRPPEPPSFACCRNLVFPCLGGWEAPSGVRSGQREERMGFYFLLPAAVVAPPSATAGSGGQARLGYVMWHLCVVSRSIYTSTAAAHKKVLRLTISHGYYSLDTLPNSDSPTNMSLIHALIARGTTVLAEHATGTAELKPGAPSLPSLSPTIPLMFL